MCARLVQQILNQLMVCANWATGAMGRQKQAAQWEHLAMKPVDLYLPIATAVHLGTSVQDLVLLIIALLFVRRAITVRRQLATTRTFLAQLEHTVNKKEPLTRTPVYPVLQEITVPKEQETKEFSVQQAITARKVLEMVQKALVPSEHIPIHLDWKMGHSVSIVRLVIIARMAQNLNLLQHLSNVQQVHTTPTTKLVTS